MVRRTQVELLSQAELREGTDWKRHLELLETATQVRSQWLRAWLLGPFGLPSFRSYEAIYTSAMLANNANRVSKLTVWFQAEKTKANPRALDQSFGPSLSLPERIRLADSTAWPSDLDAWRQCCWWLINQVPNLPPSCRADILAVFEVWQNFAADVANPFSAGLVRLADSWLAELEAGGWAGVRHYDQENIERRLRAVLLRAARAYPAVATKYLAGLQAVDQIPRSTFEQVLSFAPILSEVCAEDLITLVLHVSLGTLPEEEPPSESLLGHGSYLMDWTSLAIDDQNQFSPGAPNREPFPSLFRNAPVQARLLVRRLANHAVTAWRQLHKVDPQRRATPLALTLTFPWGDQIFWGAGQEYLWSRGQWGSSMVASALMALDAWAFEEVEKERPVDKVLSEVIEGHESVAVLAVAVAIAIETKQCSATTLPLATCQRIWQWDIGRRIAETGGLNLMGFDRSERKFCEAVVEGNKRECRGFDVRCLVPQFVFDDGDLGRDSSDKIAAFAQDLPFDYAEERSIPERVAGAMRQAEIWAESSRRENYRGTLTPDGNALIVRLDNPKAHGPDVDRIEERNAEMVAHLTLLNWTHESFKKSAVGAAISLDEAVSRARRLDSATLFSETYARVGSGRERQNAVVGVASVVLCLGRNLPPHDLEWAANVCLRAWKTPDASDERYSRASALLDHPAIYAGRGLAAMVRQEMEPRREVLEALFVLTGHFYDQIVRETLGRLLELWDEYPEVAWTALWLAISISVSEDRSPGITLEQLRTNERQRIESAIRTALVRLDTAQASTAPLPTTPPAWVPASPDAPPWRRRTSGTEGWDRPPADLNWEFLGRVVNSIPVATVMRDEARRDVFLSWCDDLVKWTVERIHPPWAGSDEHQRLDSSEHDLYEWKRRLYTFLAHVSLSLPASESARRYVEPAAKADDKTFSSLLDAYVSRLACIVMDEVAIPAEVLALLRSIVPRMLSHGAWKRAARDQGVLYDRALSNMIQAVFFVEVEEARQAARFANGNWTDVERIFPIIDPILLAQGRHPTVTTAFVTLCERAFEAYPADKFVTQLPTVLGDTPGVPSGWRGTSLPARLAGLIQRFSEKTQPVPAEMAQALLRALDALVDMGDRRAAAIQTSEVFKDVRRSTSPGRT